MQSARLLLAVLTLALVASCSEQPQTAETASAQETAPAAQGPESTFQTYPASAFFNTVSYALSGGNAWSHDDSRLLISSDATGTFNAYALNVADGSQAPLTAIEGNAHFAVSWFPDDDRAVITADTGGNELNHIYVREADGQLTDVTPGENLKASFGGWSADDQSFYVLSNERDPKAIDLYRYSAADYSREMVFENTSSWIVSALSDDGRYLVLGRANSSADSDLYLLDLTGDDPEPVHITPHEGDVSHNVYAFSRDNATLIYGTNEHGEFNQAWAYDIASGERAPYFAADWDVVYVGFSRSGAYRVTAVNADASTDIRITHTEDGKELALPSLPEGNLAQVRFSRDESKVALMVTSSTSPADVFVVDLEKQTSARLTTALNEEIDESHLVAAEVVRYKSFDGLEIPSILYRPQNASAANPVPALVWVHGGPGGQSRTGYSATLQHLVNHGYAVLAANNRGSSGYGKTFFHMDDKRHGEVDLDDIVYGKTYLQGLDWVDNDRIGIIGGSYGGYMVGAALAFRPDVFEVGINIFGVMNWVRTLESIPPWWEQQRKSLYDELGDPATDKERLTRISPLFHADSIRKPLLVVQGANDPRVLQVESDEIVAAVRRNEVPVEYVLFEDEGHGFSQRDNRVEASDAYVTFLSKYL